MGLRANSIQSNNGGGVSIKPFVSLNELRATTTEHCVSNNFVQMMVAGVLTTWQWDSTSTAVDNGVTAIKPTAIALGRWLKVSADTNATTLDGFDSSYFLMDSGVVAQADAEAGVSTVVKSWTAQRVRQAIIAYITSGLVITDGTDGSIVLPNWLGGKI